MENKQFRLIGSIGGMIVGFISTIVGLIKPWAYPALHTYGGDAYTGIQQAAALTARNISTVGSWLLIILGLALFFYFLSRLPGSDSASVTPATTPAPKTIDEELPEI